MIRSFKGHASCSLPSKVQMDLSLGLGGQSQIGVRSLSIAQSTNPPNSSHHLVVHDKINGDSQTPPPTHTPYAEQAWSLVMTSLNGPLLLRCTLAVVPQRLYTPTATK